MESKIFIDINYASRDPQIVIHSKESDDPRDKLVSMLTGHSMPGVSDGYCRIERYPGGKDGAEIAVITPINPAKLVQCIPMIVNAAENNAAIDTSGVSETWRSIVECEWNRIRPKGEKRDEPIVDPGLTMAAALEMVDHACVEKLPPGVYKIWKDNMFDYPQKSKKH